MLELECVLYSGPFFIDNTDYGSSIEIHGREKEQVDWRNDLELHVSLELFRNGRNG